MNDEEPDYFDSLLVGAEQWAIDQIRTETNKKDAEIFQLKQKLKPVKSTSSHDEVINDWFNYLDYQKSKAKELQHAAYLAKQGRRDEALAIRNKIDNQPVVFDGAPLADAVKALMAERDKLKRKLSD